MSDWLGKELKMSKGREEGDFMKHCCNKFAKQAGELQPPVGGGHLYPSIMTPNAQFEPDIENKTWNINGCCGGGCFVVTEMSFCPFCGLKLAISNDTGLA